MVFQSAAQHIELEAPQSLIGEHPINEAALDLRSKYNTWGRNHSAKTMTNLKNNIVTFFRSIGFQPIWEYLHHLSILGMNYHSGQVNLTGEIDIMKVIRRAMGNKLLVVIDV